MSSYFQLKRGVCWLFVVSFMLSPLPVQAQNVLSDGQWITSFYVAYWNRAPDAEGHAYWMGEFARGALTIPAIAENFALSEEARAAYPYFSAPHAATESEVNDFLRSVYRNLLDREVPADDEGVLYWVGELRSGATTPGAVIGNIIHAAMQANGIDWRTISVKIHFPDYVPDPNVYVWPTAPASIVEQTTAGGGTIQFPVDQIIVLMREGTGRDAAESLATALEGSIVGQIPEIMMYQIRVPSATSGALEALIAQAESDPNVAFAGFNAVNTLQQTCPASNDNADLHPVDQYAFSETEYYSALTMFDIFRPYLHLHRVTVGVVDSGLDMTTDEFWDTNILNLNGIRALPTDVDSGLHGTAMCGMIAADDYNGGVNGVASRFLHEQLALVVGVPDATTASALNYVSMAAGAGADIINLSFKGGTSPDPYFDVVRESWFRLMSRRSDVLFVAAAGTGGMELDGYNFSPGGISGLPNLITVGATAYAEPDRLAGFSNHGPAVDIAAPGENVPTVGSSGFVREISGTSIAVPMVTSLAAILKSINPSLGPAQLKQYITRYSFPMSGGIRHGRLVYPAPLMQLLIDMNPGDPVQGWLDPLGQGTHGASGAVLWRICPGQIHWSVSGYGTHAMDAIAGGGLQLGHLGRDPSTPYQFGVSGIDDDSRFSVATSTLSKFALGSYPITNDGGGGSFTAFFHDERVGAMGFGTSGTMEIETCSIDQRHPFHGGPMFMTFAGIFSGVFEVTQPGREELTYHEFDGYFSGPFSVGHYDDVELFEYLEVECEGGVSRP